MDKDRTPRSPEEYPEDVRDALGQHDVTHDGDSREAPAEENETEQEDGHLGAVETETSSVTPPMEGPDKLTRGKIDDADIDPEEELTGG